MTWGLAAERQDPAVHSAIPQLLPSTHVGTVIRVLHRGRGLRWHRFETSDASHNSFTVLTQWVRTLWCVVDSRNGDDHRMWLVRHGESTWNVQGLVQGQADDAHLTARGRGQAQRAAETLRHKSIAAIYTSDLRRAEQTARTIGCALELPVHSDPALRERSFGSREGLTLSLLDSSETGIRGDRIIDADARPDGGESLEDVYRRIAAFVRHLAEQQHSGDVVIVAHGGSIRALRAYCTGRSFQDAPWDVVSNGSVHGVQLPVHTSLRHP